DKVPHDVSAHRGQDVEMACSFRGAGTPSYSLEIQWWYIRNHLDWTDRQPWITNEVAPKEEMPKDATKISVVKVVGSNISHKLRLSRVKPSDEGTYECRVIDFSDDAGARHHRARAYLQVVNRFSAKLQMSKLRSVLSLLWLSKEKKRCFVSAGIHQGPNAAALIKDRAALCFQCQTKHAAGCILCSRVLIATSCFSFWLLCWPHRF
uniref:V-set and transmembrane domain-containing protein 2-like protein n=1 Tax=Oryzias sinensis TaxID=183150 RepID=A0A8C7ZAM1_9TELE